MAAQWFAANQVTSQRVYCPIRWTEYQIQANYGNDKREMDLLRSYVKCLPNKQYVTVCQYDDGPLADLKDCLVFSAGGLPDSAIPIPLLSNCHPDANFDYDRRYIFASFIGSVATHPIRKEIENYLSGDVAYFGADQKQSVEKFRDLMQHSKYAICPRGYGKTSFRMYEAIQYGCIPVYVSDTHWLPFYDKIDWNSFSVIVKQNEIAGMEKRLRAITDEQYRVMKQQLKKVYAEYFTYEGTFRAIARMLEDENDKAEKGRVHSKRI